MFKAISDEWKRFSSSEAGERFIDYHHRVKEASTLSRVVRIGIGMVLFAAGIVMLVAPGPGILFMVFGLACFGGESKSIAKWLDKLEVRARAGWHWATAKWKATPMAGKVLIVALALAVTGLALWGMYVVLWT